MISFTSGLIKYKDRYIPTRYITNIEKGKDNTTYVTLANQTDSMSQRSHCVKEELEGTPEQWADSYRLSEQNGGTLDVLA